MFSQTSPRIVVPTVPLNPLPCTAKCYQSIASQRKARVEMCSGKAAVHSNYRKASKEAVSSDALLVSTPRSSFRTDAHGCANNAPSPSQRYCEIYSGVPRRILGRYRLAAKCTTALSTRFEISVFNAAKFHIPFHSAMLRRTISAAEFLIAA